MRLLRPIAVGSGFVFIFLEEKNMKKIVSLLLVAVMLLGLVA